MAALSPQRERSGRKREMFSALHWVCSASLSWVLAETPPATAILLRPWVLAQRMVRGTRTSVTALLKEAAKSGRFGVSPFWSSLWMRFRLAVFSPEKDISSGALSTLLRGRG